MLSLSSLFSLILYNSSKRKTNPKQNREKSSDLFFPAASSPVSVSRQAFVAPPTGFALHATYIEASMESEATFM